MSDDAVHIFVKSSREVAELMADSEVSWSEVLRLANLNVQETKLADPVPSLDSRTKEPVTVLLASAGIVMALAPALSRVLHEIFRRPVKVTERVLLPVEDSSGSVVRDNHGNPTFQWVDRTRLLTPEQSSAKSSASLKGPFQLELKIEEAS
jgi:hypothetical protein